MSSKDKQVSLLYNGSSMNRRNTMCRYNMPTIMEKKLSTVCYIAYVICTIVHFKGVESMDMLSLTALKQSGNTMDVNIMDVHASKNQKTIIWKTYKNGLKEKQN